MFVQVHDVGESVSEWEREGETDKKKKEQERRRFCVYVYVFLAVNQYANEAWSVILLQLISLNPPSPGLGTAHAHRHAWVNTAAHTLAHTHKLVLTRWLKHPTSQKYKHSFAYALKHLSVSYY